SDRPYGNRSAGLAPWCCLLHTPPPILRLRHTTPCYKWAMAWPWYPYPKLTPPPCSNPILEWYRQYVVQSAYPPSREICVPDRINLHRWPRWCQYSRRKHRLYMHRYHSRCRICRLRRNSATTGLFPRKDRKPYTNI